MPRDNMNARLAITNTPSGLDEVRAAGSFTALQAEASDVLNSLGGRVANVLSALGSFRRPADVQKALGLDQTLSRQVFRVASAVDPLTNSSVIPSRTSMGRFLDAARVRRIDQAKLEDVWKAYENFEELVRVHADDRSTFNTMLSSLRSEDEEWMSTDNQHRRNAFRAMSHAIGTQCKTRVNLFVADQIDSGAAHEIACLSGIIGLRFLQPKSRVSLHGNAILNKGTSKNERDMDEGNWKSLQLSDTADGLLIDEFSSKPVPPLRIEEGVHDGQIWREVVTDHPQMGNKGISTLYFASWCRRIVDDGSINFLSTTNRPTEVLFLDALVGPDVAGGARPSGRAYLGNHERFGADPSPLRGKFAPELLGIGPQALATPEVPYYPDIVKAMSDKLNRNLDAYKAYRIRVEFPFFQSTVAMEWMTKG